MEWQPTCQKCNEKMFINKWGDFWCVQCGDGEQGKQLDNFMKQDTIYWADEESEPVKETDQEDEEMFDDSED